MISFKTLKDFDATLIQRVISGTAHVLKYGEWRKLPQYLKDRYYPQFRRFDTPYRLMPEYMEAQEDIDPNTISTTIITPRPVLINPQLVDVRKIKTRQGPANVSLITTNPNTTDTPLSKKSIAQVALTTWQLVRNRRGVTTKFSKY